MAANAINIIDLLDVQDNDLDFISSSLVFNRPLPHLIFDIKAAVIHMITLCQRDSLALICETY